MYLSAFTQELYSEILVPYFLFQYATIYAYSFVTQLHLFHSKLLASFQIKNLHVKHMIRY